MMMQNTTYCTCTKINYKLKEGTKTVYTEVDRETINFTEEQYKNCIDSPHFFKSAGWSESQQKGYTSRGYKVIEMTSKTPDKTEKTIRQFDFNID